MPDSSIMTRFWQRSAGRLLTQIGQTQDQRERQQPVLQRSDLFDPAQHWQIFQTGAAQHIDYVSIDCVGPEAAKCTWQGSSHDFPVPFLVELPEARLHGRHAVVLTPEGRVLLESTLGGARYLGMSSLARLHHPRTPGEALRQGLHTAHFEFVAPLVNLWSAGYYHWLIEGLPRLQVIEAYAAEHGQRPRLLIDPNPAAWVRESLRLLGYGPEDYMEWHVTRAQVKHALVPWFPGSVGRPSPLACRWLSQRFRDALGLKPGVQPRRIYVSRRRAQRRRVVNESLLVEWLQPLGFEVFELEALNFSQQIELFSQAEIVVGPHGAGLANMIFAPHTAVIEFLEPVYQNFCYYHLASGLGFPHKVLIGKSHGEDILIDPQAVIEAVQALL